MWLLAIKRWHHRFIPSHCRPCLRSPYNNEPQWSQNVNRL